jgi:D-threo-aldose 1-dehydrogenase
VHPRELRQLGASGVAVTALGFGGATLGDIHGSIDESQAERTIEAAIDSGIAFFDTAPWYGLGLSEHRMGRVLRSKPRESFVLSTKVGRLLRRPVDPARYASPTWPHGMAFEPRFDYSGVGLMRSYEDSLARLGLNRVDALLVHDVDFLYQSDEDGIARCFAQLENEGGFAALQALRARGEVGAIGAGINATGFIPRFLERFEMDFFLVAMPYTLLDQDALREFELCRERGVSVVIGAPFASGILAGGGGGTYDYGEPNAAVRDRTTRLRAVCERYGVPLGAAALQFVLAHSVVASVIPGPNSPEQVHANLDWVQEPIPSALWENLFAEGLIRPGTPVPSA